MGATSSISSKQSSKHSSKQSNDMMGIIPDASMTSAKSIRHAKRNENYSQGSYSSNQTPPAARIMTKEMQLERVVEKNVKKFMNDAIKKSALKQLANEETYMDSVYIKNWLSQSEADDLLDELTEIGRDIRPIDTAEAAKKRAKYPLWTKTYGYKRVKDGARALDRWGSYHESWVRVEEPPKALKVCAEKLRKRFHLSQDDVNSMVVNYYYDGSNTYIPAHRDTTACLADNSQVICLSLGATRDFVLCENSDAGKFEKSTMTLGKEWKVGHGDLFALGQKTNKAYCHAVTQDRSVQNMRISVIFRSVSRSFIDLDNAPVKEAVYSNGNRKTFAAECITTSGYHDAGKREHLADLITEREEKKAAASNKSREFTNITAYEKELNISNADRMQEALTSSMKLSNVNGNDEVHDSASTRTASSDEQGDDRKPRSVQCTSAALQSTVSSYYMGRGCAVPLQ